MKRFTAGVLSAALIALSPGFEGYRAFGQTISVGGHAGKAPVAVPIAVVPSQIGSLPLQFNPSLPSGFSLPTIGAPSVSASVLPSAASNAAIPVAPANISALLPGVPSVALPAAAVPDLPVPAIGLTAAPQAETPEDMPASTREVLTSGADQLSLARTDNDRRTILSDLFTGRSKASADLTGPVPTFSPADGTQGSLQASRPQTIPVPELEAVAVDSAKPEMDRKKAVDSIASVPGAETDSSLRRIADSNPLGGASDYEVHRQALRALAGRGVILSLRPVSPGHAQQILARLSQNKPTLAIFDYDDTLAPWAKPIAPETAEALKLAADAGIQPVILTDRPDASENPKETTILQSISGMTPEQKAVLGVVSSKGTRALAYDAKSEARLVRDVQIAWEQAEGESIKAAGKAVKEKYGSVIFNGREEELSKDSYFRPLPVGTAETDVKAAAQLMQDELKKRGMDVEVIGRMAKDPALPPYISLSKVDKAIGVSWLRTHLGYIGRLRDLAAMGIKGRLFDKLA
ncbi:MAG: hypothetical protein HZB91_11530, partial [Elusimicrobia bacterium]|nr:hypothetical protein [Elusimicrobiota bacterium]